MTIAEKLFQSDSDTLFKIIVLYQLDWLARLYFPDSLVESAIDISRLMMPSTYSGRTERRGGAITQPHRQVIK